MLTYADVYVQMLENWCWQEEPLRRMSGLYSDEAQPLPDALLNSMIAAKNVNSALMTLRQCFFGKYDMSVHSGNVSQGTAALWAEMRESVTLIANSSGGNGAASFGHIMGGYDAGYYGYLWSEVFSADMFSIFKNSGDLFSAEVFAPQYFYFCTSKASKLSSGSWCRLGRDTASAS